jgi:hypothetical protein
VLEEQPAWHNLILGRPSESLVQDHLNFGWVTTIRAKRSFLTLATGAPRRCPGSESASGGRSSSYPNTAEANKPTASQSAAHSPNDRNNTAVMDTRSDQ